MPKKLPPLEEKILRCYIQEGAREEKVPVVAKRYRITVAAVTKVLKLKRVQEALEVRMAPVRLEQQRQELVGAAVTEATAKLEAEQAELESRLAAATTMPPMPVIGNEAVIEQELMRLVRLCPEKHGRIKLASIQTAFVVAGLMEQGNTRRVLPPDKPAESSEGGTYTNVFATMRLAPAPATQPTAAAPVPPAEGVPAKGEVEPAKPKVIEAKAEIPDADGVFDLVPGRVPVAASGPSLLATLEAAVPKRKPSTRIAEDVITVEIG